MDKIVRGRGKDERSFGSRKQSPQGFHHPLAASVSKKSMLSKAVPEGSQYGSGAVRGGIITDQELERGVGLFGQAGEGIGQQGRLVPGGQKDRDFWKWRGFHAECMINSTTSDPRTISPAVSAGALGSDFREIP